MLTAQEQEQILACVRTLINVEVQVDRRRKSGIISPQSMKASRERAWDNLRDVLKEVG
ncbi:hypothetical protein [Acidovorax phage ACPWH]|nr:hypothetical protein [Acidovorax phage ACPWH]